MWWIILAVAVPFLFLIGVIYNAIKAQRRLEKEVLPHLKEQREAELARLQQQYKVRPQPPSADDDDDDDWPASGQHKSPQPHDKTGQG